MIKEIYDVLTEIKNRTDNYEDDLPPQKQRLKDLGYIKLKQVIRNGIYHDTWILTDKAKAEIELYERENRIEERAEVANANGKEANKINKHSNIISIVAIIIALLSCIFTGLTYINSCSYKSNEHCYIQCNSHYTGNNSNNT